MNVTFEFSENLTPTVKTFWFRPHKPIHYVAGQFTEMHLSHVADERGQRRWFTLSSSPTEDLLAVTTKFVNNGSTFKKEMKKLAPGQEITLAQPMGDFILPKDTSIPLLFIAGGMGITPFRSILKYLKDTKESRNISMLYAVQTEQDLLFTDLINEQAANCQFIVSKPTITWSGISGHISVQRIKDIADISKAMIFFSGPEPMVESFYKQLLQEGVPPHRLVMDYFPGYQMF